MSDQPREALPHTEGSSRLLWGGAALALLVHLLPFVWFGDAEPLGEGVLTEAIAVELVDKATVEGLDQTPAARPEAPAPPPAPPSQQAPPRPPQKAQPAVPPSPPPSQAAPAEKPQKDAAKPPAPAPPAFTGDEGLAPKPKQKPEEPEKKEATKEDPEPDAANPSPQASPPQQAAPPPTPSPQPSAKAAPPQAASAPAQAKSGQVTKFAKEVVAALAKAKPNAPGIKGKVTVTVVVAFGGGVRVAKVTGSSGRDDLDKLALEAAKKAPLPAPPPDVATDDLFYDVEYDFK